MSTSRYIPVLFLFFFLLTSSPGVLASSAEDGFIQGYGTAVLVREFGVSPSAIRVSNGVVTVNAGLIKPGDLSEVISILMGIEGVTRVEIAGSEARTTAGAPAGGPETGEVPKTAEKDSSAPGQEAALHKYDRLFEPLMADPRWPRFAISYEFFTDNGELNNLIASAIGGTIPVYEDDQPFIGRWRIAVQAAVFSINDLDTSSWDLLNSDYRFGLAFLSKKGSASNIFRVYHFSTHVGDEFILNSGAEREELSYEAVDTIYSYSPRGWLRVYGGGAYRFSRHPKDLDPWSVQYGLELKGPRQYLKILRPVAGANFYNKGENDWRSEISLRMGVEIENRETLGHKVQFLIGYYNGPSPYGQFFYQSQEFLDFGIHLYF
jgi:hypothetical protein